MAFKNYYDILGILNTSSNQDIKKAYRKLSLKFHPDKNEEDEFLTEMFKNINEAYSVLSDLEKRKFFDESLALIKSFEEKKIKKCNISNHELYHLKQLTNLYLEKQELEESKTIEYYEVENKIIPLYFSLKLYLFLILISASSFLVLQPEFYYSKLIPNYTHYNYYWSTSYKTSVYTEPNIESKKIGVFPPDINFRSKKFINEFLNIKFVDPFGVVINGYIEKKDLVYRDKQEKLLLQILHPKRILNHEDKSKEIYKIIIEHHPDYQIIAYEDYYVVKSKKKEESFKYMIVNESIEEYIYMVDLNIENVKTKMEAFGYIFDKFSQNYVSKDISNCVYIELHEINRTQTEIKYAYNCE